MIWFGILIQTIVVGYIVVSLSHLATQVIFAHLHHIKCQEEELRFRRYTQRLLRQNKYPSIGIIYPIYNEEPEVLEKVMRAAQKCLQIPNLTILFVDDGSKNVEDVRPVYEAYESDRMKVVYKQNAGKREAQYTGFKYLDKVDYYITVDSDTIINTAGIYRLMSPIIRYKNIGAVTGDLKVENSQNNLLTRIIALRYWMACNFERAAQSLTGTMLCCAGPFTVYRGDIIRNVQEAYISQTFFGTKCTYGDDRHLTNLVIREGYNTRYQEEAYASTYVPTTMKEYLTQQTRWSKSFLREIIWTLQAHDKISFYSLIDTFIQPLLFFGFLLAVSNSIHLLFSTGDIRFAIYYFALVIIMSTLYAAYGIVRTRNWQFLLFSLYGFIHVFAIMSVRLKAVFTLNDNGWGTRSKKKKNVWLEHSKWFGVYGLLLGTTATIIGLFTGNRWIGETFHFSVQNNATFENFYRAVTTTWSLAIYPTIAVLLVFSAFTFFRQAHNLTKQTRVRLGLISLNLFLILVLSALITFSPGVGVEALELNAVSKAGFQTIKDICNINIIWIY